jgi:hypothetical protein
MTIQPAPVVSPLLYPLSGNNLGWVPFHIHKRRPKLCKRTTRWEVEVSEEADAVRVHGAGSITES